MEIVNCQKNQDSFENLQEENEKREEINKINKEKQKQDLEKKINLEIDKFKIIVYQIWTKIILHKKLQKNQ